MSLMALLILILVKLFIVIIRFIKYNGDIE